MAFQRVMRGVKLRCQPAHHATGLDGLADVQRAAQLQPLPFHQQTALGLGDGVAYGVKQVAQFFVRQLGGPALCVGHGVGKAARLHGVLPGGLLQLHVGQVVVGVVRGSCVYLVHSAHKADKCKCSLCRHNAVAAALEALGAAIVHPVGQPINHSVKAGFKRRGEVGPLLDDSPGQAGVGWAWCENWRSMNW
jgi:hypothetical protein